MKVMASVAIYAAPIKAAAMERNKAAYRRYGLRVISAFRTVYTDAAVVIAVIMPLKQVVDVEI